MAGIATFSEIFAFVFMVLLALLLVSLITYLLNLFEI